MEEILTVVEGENIKEEKVILCKIQEASPDPNDDRTKTFIIYEDGTEEYE